MVNVYAGYYHPNSVFQAIQGKNQIENSCGAYVFKLDPWDNLKRFLILGTSSGSYYATSEKLTATNAKVVIDLIAVDGVRVVKEIVEIASSNRAPKKSPCIFALSLVLLSGSPEAKQEAYKSINKVCGYSTHLFELMEYIQKWSHGLRNAVAKFYLEKEADKIAYQVVKYRQRNGWTHKDVLRLAHPKTKDEAKNSIFKWVVGKAEPLEKLHPLIEAYELLKTEKDLGKICCIIADNKMTWEMIPTELLNSPQVWAVLLPNTPLMALVRNLGRLTSIGVISPFSEWSVTICKRIMNDEEIKRSKVHPLFLYNALRVYREGQGDKGSLRWNPNSHILQALEAAFYFSFGNVEKSNKNIVIALDVSGSMGCAVAGMKLTAIEASAIMSMVVAKSNPNSVFLAFSNGIMQLPIHAGMDLPTVWSVISDLPFSSTDCSLPFHWAARQGIKNVDAFAVFTDSETNSGGHPIQTLNNYRKFSGNPKVKLAVWGMTATNFTINDPNDVNGMDLVGFDTAAPAIFQEFIKS